MVSLMATDQTDEITKANQRAWNAGRFDVWLSAFGSIEAEAARIVADPRHVLRRILPYLGKVAGQRICNVQGSHGRLAVALARLGASVTVIDFSEENRRFALGLAEAAGVAIDYALCDVMEASSLGRAHEFDVLVLELGILHYHQDLDGFFEVMRELAASGCTLLLNEFHPVQRKLFWPSGPHDYFHTELVEADVPSPETDGASLGKCRYRFWTMAEVLTAIIKAGFTLEQLEEHPDWSDATIPGSFTLLARA